MPRGYRSSNYDFVIDSSFQPFTMQEMLVPFNAYKDAFEKSEEAYNDLSTQADKFKYLSETLPEGSKARQIYEGYANDLKTQAVDLAHNGLTMGNRRALTGLKRRFQGEIGRLMEADTALKKEQELRRQMGLKDGSILYAEDNLNIDRFLDNNTPNLYSISGNELYTKGAAAGKAASARIYGTEDGGSTLGGYYRDYVQKMGYTPEQLNRFGDQISADFASKVSELPELQAAANQILEANGVNGNLTGDNLRRAQQQVIRGIIDGAVYTEKHDPQRDLGILTASEKAAEARADRQFNEITKPTFDMQKQDWEDRRKLTYTFDENGNVTGFNPDYINGNYEVDPNTGKLRKKPTTQTPEEKEAEKQYKKIRTAKTLTDVEKAGYVPIFATVHPSHGGRSGVSAEDADRLEKYDNIEGWRSGPSGNDVPDLYIDWTDAPLIRGARSTIPDIIQWRSGSYNSPNNGDFAYQDEDFKNMQTKVLSDQEYANLPPAVIKSIEAELRRQGYDDDTEFQVMEVVGKKGKRSYMTMVKSENQILQGE